MSLDDAQLEYSVLAEILSLHPAHLTSSELALKMTDERSGAGEIPTMGALEALKRSGLVRQNGDVVAPTYAAFRAAALFQRA
jgi:hypothetical protein